MSPESRTRGRSRGGGGRRSTRPLDVKRHLEREDPTTTSVRVARIWTEAYTELVEFEEAILAGLNKRLVTLSEDARHEAELTNLPMIVHRSSAESSWRHGAN
ncbi:MAG: hypothetical protein E6I39_04930 [Chloroflexi bacterium]|nr:MAG: hypothetical protein E6I39_04930 [Chloroflexota bacterium]